MGAANAVGLQRRALADSALAEKRLEQRVVERTSALEAANLRLRDSEAKLRGTSRWAYAPRLPG